MAGEFNVPGVVKVGGQASLDMGQTDHTSDETSRPARSTTTTTTTTIMPAQYVDATLKTIWGSRMSDESSRQDI